ILAGQECRTHGCIEDMPVQWRLVTVLGDENGRLRSPKVLIAPPWGWFKNSSVPVKNNAVQSMCFVLCGFGLALGAWRLRTQNRSRAIGMALAALLFLADIHFILVSKTGLLVELALAGLFLLHIGRPYPQTNPASCGWSVAQKYMQRNFLPLRERLLSLIAIATILTKGRCHNEPQLSPISTLQHRH
ncbi:MAG: hypothetical protein FWD68_12635, partial [Alphaproteobacteria bacterium]|nr:hypothetical protein [Alphaproteobacteria bacterium]